MHLFLQACFLVSTKILLHHGDKLLIVYLSVPVDVSFPEHLVNLHIGELLPEIGHDVAQLSRRDEAISVLVEDPESLPDLLLAVRVLHLPRHHSEELVEVDGSVCVYLVDHVLELCLGGVLPERPHDSAQLLRGDGVEFLIKI